MSLAKLLLAVACLLLFLGSPGRAYEALPGLDGNELTEQDLESGALILVVWASWSPRCDDVLARVRALAERWSSRARIATVVFQEDEETIRRFLGARDLDTVVYLDRSGAFSKRHAVTTLPGLLVFAHGERVLSVKLPADPDRLIEQALADPS